MAKASYSADDVSADGEGASDGLFLKLKQWYTYDLNHVNQWRTGDENDGGAKEDWDFYNLRQWSDEDKRALKSKNRPGQTFDQIGPIVNAVVGSEINNRREVRYFPREEGDAKSNEVLTAAAEWFRDECGAEDEESDAWKSTVVAGMGWTDTRLDFEMNPDGEPEVENINEFEMVWDCNSSKPNLADADHMFRVREITLQEAIELTGEKDRKKLNAAWAKKDSDDKKEHDQQAADNYDGTQSDNAGVYPKKCVIVEARWLDKETFYRGPDPENPDKPKEYSPEQFKAVSKLYQEQTGKDFPAVKQVRKVLKRAFLGSEILGKVDRPMVPEGTGLFGWECITGYKDKNKNQWYGIVRAAKDPQRWANKWLSQTIHLMNSQSKGGILAERGAFENDRQADATWAKADEVTWLAPGSLSGEKPKIMPKSPAQFPAGFFTLYQEARDSVNDATGLSKEFIGTREAEQAGVLEYQRRQSSLNLLAEMFNSLRRYRKRQGRTLLYLIQEHLSDGRLVRIVGDDLGQYVPLMNAKGIAEKKQQLLQELQQQAMQQGQMLDPQQAQAMVEEKTKGLVPVDGEYDIIVDDAPSSPNEKDRTWQIILQMLPFMKDMITPEIAIELMGISPLPASLVQKLKDKAAEAAQQPQPPTPEEQKMQADKQKAELDAQGQMQKIEGEKAKIGMQLEAQQQKNQMEVQKSGIDLMIKAQEAQLDQKIAEQKHSMDLQKLAVQEQQNAMARKEANAKRTSAAK